MKLLVFLLVAVLVLSSLVLPVVDAKRRKRDKKSMIKGHTASVPEETSVPEEQDAPTDQKVPDAEDSSTTTEEETYACVMDGDCADHQTCSLDISKCVDCDDAVGGNTMVDACGHCGGDGSSCADCNGEAYGEAEVDDCGVCAAGSTGHTPNVDKDDCGVCKGNNADKDDCGVCFGENADRDCEGICFGAAVSDHCGKCGGSNACCSTGKGVLCNDHGACDGSIKACACDFGWTGQFCSLPQSYCHDASGEIALVDCGNRGVCSEPQKGACICEEGYYGPTCQYKTCSGNGVYSPSIKTCMCAAGFGGADCGRCAVPGETRALQEMFYKLLQEEVSAVAITFGVEEDNTNLDLADAISSKPPKSDNGMTYICIPPRIYTQKFFDSVTVMTSPTKLGQLSKNAEERAINRLLVDYMLIPVPNELVKVYLNGRRAIVQGLDDKPVLPNTTHHGVFFDCGCKAWPIEMVEAIEESGDAEARWMGSPAPNALHGRSRMTRTQGGSTALEERAVITSGECVDLLDECLDVLSSMVSAETGTADEIGTAIDKGMDRQRFIGDFLTILIAALVGFTVLGIGAMATGVYLILIVKSLRKVATS